MDEIKRALLGDKDAQQAVTERGELLPCPSCGGESTIKAPPANYAYRVACLACRMNTGGCKTKEEAIEKWNTRPQLLTAEEMEIGGVGK